MYPIVQAPNEILRSKAVPANLTPKKIKEIVSGMTKVLLAQKDPEGVGLAANQVGLPYSIFLARFTTKKSEPIRVFINPRIVDHSEEIQNETKDSPLEGCLSIPKYYGVVQRWKSVKIEYQKFNPVTGSLGDWVTDLFEGFPAVVVQHEMDHLNGTVFVERILEQNGRLYKVTGKNKKGKDEWDEVILK